MANGNGKGRKNPKSFTENVSFIAGLKSILFNPLTYVPKKKKKGGKKGK